MRKIRVTQVKSAIDRPERQKLTLKALGLNKMNASREVEANAQILGMVRTVNHLIQVEEVGGEDVQAPAEITAVEATPVADNTDVAPRQVSEEARSADATQAAEATGSNPSEQEAPVTGETAAREDSESDKPGMTGSATTPASDPS